MAPLTRTNTTVLLVCEAYAEVEWVRVIRAFYLPRGCGISLRPENRRGYGGAAALTLAVQRRREGEYDRVGVVVDTDQHWGDAQRQTAIENGITAIECIPCMEAMLLSVDGQPTHDRTADNKNAFERKYGGPANRPGVIRRHFPRAKFDDARSRVFAVDRCLTLLNL